MGDCRTFLYLFPTEFWPLITISHASSFHSNVNTTRDKRSQLISSTRFVFVMLNVSLSSFVAFLGMPLSCTISSYDMSFTIYESFLMEIINLNLIHNESTQSSVALVSSLKWKCFAHQQNSHKKLYQVSNKRNFQM